MVAEKLFDLPVRRRGFLFAAGAAVFAGSFGTPGFVFGAEDDFAVFMKTSLFLTGRAKLDPVLGRKIFASLSVSDKEFVKNLRALDKFAASSGVSAENLQEELNKKAGDISAVPGKIARAWYLGVVGEGKNAVAVAYEDALMFAPVADIAVIPSYSTGAYGSWVNPPLAADREG